METLNIWEYQCQECGNYCLTIEAIPWENTGDKGICDPCWERLKVEWGAEWVNELFDIEAVHCAFCGNEMEYIWQDDWYWCCGCGQGKPAVGSRRRTHMNLNDLALRCHEDAIKNGWWDTAECVHVSDPVNCTLCHGTRLLALLNRNQGELIALMHSELSEALEELRNQGMILGTFYIDNGKPSGPAVELVDCVIRIFDALSAYGVDVEKLMMAKLEYNQTRGKRHGGRTM